MNKTFLISLVFVIVLAASAATFYLTQQQAKDALEVTTPATTTPQRTVPKTPPAAVTTPEPVETTPVWTKGSVAVKGTYADADTVKLTDGSYRMYYSVQPEVAGNKFEVYSSTSADGLTWKQDAGTRKTMSTFPEVVVLKDATYRMYFQSAGLIKSASSTDGLAWKDESGTRIDKANDLGLTFDNVAAPTVTTLADGSFMMVYRGTINTPYVGEPVPNKNIQMLLWATSKDGLTWVKKGLALDTRNTTFYGLADGPELFDYDGVLKLSFWSYTGVYWASVDATAGTFATPSKEFALAESTALNKFPVPTPGDPTYAKFGSMWYMYYGQKDGIYYATLK